MQQVVVSQQTGYARNASESAYPNLWTGLVGWWLPSVNPRGGNRLFDLSPFRNHGTLTNMSNDDWVVSGGAGALDFDGVSNRVSIPANSAFAPTNAAYSAWIKAASLTGTDKSFFSQISSGGDVGRALRRDTNQIQFTIASSLGNYRVWRSTSTITTNWTHVCVTQIGVDTPKIYINGIESSVSLILSGGTPTPPTAQVLSLGFDGEFIQTLYNFAGLIDDCRIYSRALTPPEIRLLASKRGIGLQPRPKQYTYSQTVTGSKRRRILTGMP